jgi:lysozyme
LTPKPSLAEANQLFDHDVVAAGEDVRGLVKIPLTQAQFDALVSLRYNIGPTLFRGSHLLACLNAGHYHQALKEWAEFRLITREISPGVFVKEVSHGLEARRKAEIEIFKSGLPGS